MAQGTAQNAPRISLPERDRRYAAIRAQLKDRGLDGVLVSGSNLYGATVLNRCSPGTRTRRRTARCRSEHARLGGSRPPSTLRHWDVHAWESVDG